MLLRETTPQIERGMLKFPLFDTVEASESTVRVQMPAHQDAEFVAMQEGVLNIWALHNRQIGWRERTFLIVRTGELLPVHQMKHRGSVIDGPFVWHLFEMLE